MDDLTYQPGDLILLEDVCGLLGLNRENARRQAAIGKLPFPAFRLGNSRKGPLYVLRADLNRVIEERRAKAQALSHRMASAA